MSLEYIRKTYGVSAKRSARVRVQRDGRLGVITGSRAARSPDSRR